MNIRPINNVSYSIPHFTGKNKTNKEQNAASSRLGITVPLATLIAMSPMTSAGTPNIPDANTANTTIIVSTLRDKLTDDTNLLKTERYRGNDGILRKVYYVNNKENSQKVKDIYINDDDIDGKRITEYKNITLRLVGDDGVEGKTFEFPQLTVQATDDNGSVYGYTERNISDNLAKFLLSEENNTNIRTKNITKEVRAGKYGLVNAENKNTRWTKVEADHSFGYPVAAWARQVDGETYFINAYSTDRNKNDYEVVTIQRAGKPEFQVAGLKNVTSSLIDAGEPIGDFSYNQITLLKNKETSFARIFNDTLFKDLKELTNDPRNKAFKLEDIEETQIVDHKGNIYDVE